MLIMVCYKSRFFKYSHAQDANIVNLNPNLQQIMRLIKAKNYRAAKTHLEAYTLSSSQDEWGWYLLAYVTREKQKRVECLQHCLSINPENILAANQLARLAALPTPQAKKSDQRTTASTQFAVITKDKPSLQARWTQFQHTGITRFFTYSLKRMAAILATIFLGVFFTILVINQSGQIDDSVHRQIVQEVTQFVYTGWGRLSNEDAMSHPLYEQRARELGLSLPFLPRHVVWTYRFLSFQWGEAQFPERIGSHLTTISTSNIRDIVFGALPYTLLIMGAAYLFIFLLGIPISLHLSRHNGGWLDRLFSFLSPISSIPSWVIGILLMFIFAVELQLLPIGGVYNAKPPDSQWEYVLVVGKHMILPVLSIFMALFFQLIYTWRTYFLLFSEEEYVELAVAKGLPNPQMQRKYILRPSIPYVVTSFALTFVSFWQTTTALEVIFNWPGIGFTYIKSLPDFFGESMFPGDLLVAIAIVVIFAYLLGFLVFVLDVIYALADPRIRIGEQDEQYRIKRSKFHSSWWKRREHAQKNADSIKKKPVTLKLPLPQMKAFTHKAYQAVKLFWKELIRYPSAIIGLFIILLFIIGSFYAVFAYPYEESGRSWYTTRLTGQPRVPRLAKPTWVNWFRVDKLPDTISLDSSLGEAEKQVTRNPDGNDEISILYTFEYPYGDVPQNILIYYDAKYDVKKPFATVTWIPPNGEEYVFRGTAAETLAFDLSENVSVRRYLMQNPEWREWFTTEGTYATSALWALFAAPNTSEPVVQQGTYQLRIDALLFEENNDLDAELLLLGQVYGLGGTDFMRRDLMFPLLWGMPYVIFFGLFGAVITTILALIVAALGVWYGGWVDMLFQRITEANMILPILAISILLHVMFNVNLVIIITLVILMNVFSTPTKTFRSAFLQIKEAPYIEAAQAYGASSSRLVFTYMIPRILPVIVPQLVILIPGFIFLEATFGLFNIKSMYPTWGRIIYEGLRQGAMYGSRYWVLEPLFMLLLTSFAFTLLGIALDKVLNPKLKKD